MGSERRQNCTRCKKRPAVVGKRSCSRCLADRRRYIQKVHREQKRKNKCVKCGKQQAKDGSCPHCAERAKRRANRREIAELQKPTSFDIGSMDKIRVLQRRAALGLPLHVFGDTCTEYVHDMRRCEENANNKAA